MTDHLNFIMKWECGEPSEEEVIKGFQALIDDGMAWRLQGMYGRQAQGLINAGLCHRAEASYPPPNPVGTGEL